MITSCPFCGCTNISIGVIQCVDNECFTIYRSSKKKHVWFLDIKNHITNDTDFEVTNAELERMDGKPSIKVNFSYEDFINKIPNKEKFVKFVENCRVYM